MGRTTALILAAGLALGVGAGTASAQDNYPTKPVTFLVAGAVGSQADLVARVVMEQLGAVLKQSVVVTPVPGAAGLIGAEQLKRAAPDGYTIGHMPNSMLATLPAIRKTPVSWDSEKDYIPIHAMNQSMSALAVPASLPVKDVQEFVALAKKQPGKLNYGSGGPGSNQHMAMALFMSLTDTDLTQVPYPSPVQAATALATDTIQAFFITPSAAAPHLQTGKIKLLASSGKTRNPKFGDIPTLDEAGVKGYEFTTWSGVFAPVGTPAPIVQKLRNAMAEVMANKDVLAKIDKLGVDPWPAKHDELSARITSELAVMRKVAKEANISVD